MPNFMSEQLPDLSPMLRQYREIKERHQDAILMYRIGDFYEMFYEDAVAASKVLEIVLTSRNKQDENPVPLCGVPYHSVEPYITRLLDQGFKVAICDQVEDPRVAKGIVRREVTRVVTPGLLLNPEAPKRSSYLAAVVPSEEQWGISWVEFSTGEFVVGELLAEEVLEILRGGEIRELLLPEGEGDLSFNFTQPVLLNKLPSWVFDETRSKKLLQEQFKVATLSGFDCEGIPLGIQAAGAILHYVRETQKVERVPHLVNLRRYRKSGHLLMSEETRRSLDLDPLMEMLDRTETAMGGRKLRQWVSLPLVQKDLILERHEVVDELLRRREVSASLKENLKQVYDLERIAGRISLATANARDLVSLASSLQAVERIRGYFQGLTSRLLQQMLFEWDSLPEVVGEIEKIIGPEPPFSLREGGLIADQFSKELDTLREISRSSRDYLAQLEERERKRSGIHSLKVRFNKVFGYYIEVTTANLSRVPGDYIRKQTLVNAERFITPELKEFEGKILGADEKIRNLEYQLFCELRDRLTLSLDRLQKQADRLATLDVLSSFALVSEERRYIRPELSDGNDLFIQGGRHPLVEASLSYGKYIENDLEFRQTDQRFLLITGPNMAGKSTLIRSVGLIVLMAQSGCFVPARSAHIGLVDKIFSRIGASDRLNRGESTFMVEMTETASLLHYATDKSLILLDELGRGTSTFDGISIAWAVSEYLHDKVQSRTLFATHYHELIDLERSCPALKNFNVMVREEGEGIVFLYKLAPGGMGHSYGIHVARLAGLPATILERSKEVLKNLESEKEQSCFKRSGKRKVHEGQSRLF